MVVANTKPILLELGGKAPVIVCEDADLDLAARYCVLGAFLFSGQVCMSTERILVARTVNAVFEEKLREWVERLFPSNEHAFILRNELAVKRNLALVKDALDKGARVVSTGINDSAISSTRMRPVIVADIQPNMYIYKTESFGPTVSVMQFDTENEAISIANDTEYGLTSSIFTQDPRKALRQVLYVSTT
jgi:acyl-CoA reductase-like NAD-dependent aldehyde dehydrogenase